MRRKSRLRAWLLGVAAAGLAGAASAYEPCAETGDLKRTIAAADLIVIARSPKNPTGGPGSGPKSYEVAVERVVKGRLPSTAKKISVLGWQGMCPYGIACFS